MQSFISLFKVSGKKIWNTNFVPIPDILLLFPFPLYFSKFSSTHMTNFTCILKCMAHYTEISLRNHEILEWSLVHSFGHLGKVMLEKQIHIVFFLLTYFGKGKSSRSYIKHCLSHFPPLVTCNEVCPQTFGLPLAGTSLAWLYRSVNWKVQDRNGKGPLQSLLEDFSSCLPGYQRTWPKNGPLGDAVETTFIGSKWEKSSPVLKTQKQDHESPARTKWNLRQLPD
jgi:hypothetical protein